MQCRELRLPVQIAYDEKQIVVVSTDGRQIADSHLRQDLGQRVAMANNQDILRRNVFLNVCGQGTTVVALDDNRLYSELSGQRLCGLLRTFDLSDINCTKASVTQGLCQ